MNGWSMFLIFTGIICAVVAIIMDTSVATSSGRVHNIGLMNLQTNLLIFSGIVFVSGILLIGYKSKSSTISAEELRECPFCAEQIKLKATICRFCQRDSPEFDFDKSVPSESNDEIVSVVKEPLINPKYLQIGLPK